MLKLTPNPTFKAKVGIPVPGQKDAVVTFEFRHRTREQLRGFITPAEDGTQKTLDEAAREVVVGWEGIDEPFSAEALLVLFDNYPGSAFAIVQAFSDELGKARAKN